LPGEIEAAEFEAIRKTTEELKLSDCLLLTERYARDENAVPPVYSLRRRLLKDGIDYTQFDIWSTRVEIPLRELLMTCANAVPLSNRSESNTSQGQSLILTGPAIRANQLRLDP